MGNRREFLKSAAALGAVGIAGSGTPDSLAQILSSPDHQVSDRAYWLAGMQKLARPVLANLSRRQLKKMMPIEAIHPAGRKPYTHLEAFGRLMAGLAPWLAATGLDDDEKKVRDEMAQLAHASLDAATDPASPDFLNFDHGSQPLVDAAFLVQGILRAPAALWHSLESRVQDQVIAALKSSRKIGTPASNNWVLFTAMIEAALHTMGETTVQERYQDCVAHMLSWYKGDGAYGDGEFFHWDYYNSFVIHPMLLDVLNILKEHDSHFAPLHRTELARARRYAEIQERFIAPDGTFPSLGRSTTYRFGAFHALAQIALMGELPARVKPAQVRCALTAVIRKMMEAPGTFDENGWLQIGFYGHQPSLAEAYISTGSLYLCATALLPLGLPPGDKFWSAPPAPWTSQQLWSGVSLPPDHAITDGRS